MLLLLLVGFVPGHPGLVIDKLFEVLADDPQELDPVQIFALVVEDDAAGIQPILNFLDVFYWDGTDFGEVLIVLHHEDHVETLYIRVHSFEASNLNLINWHYEKPVLRDVNKTTFSRLQQAIVVERIPIKPCIPVRNLKPEVLAYKLLTALHPDPKLFVKFLSCLFLSLLVILILAAVASPASATDILSIGATLGVELHILGLLLADEDGLMQSEVDGRDDFSLAGLEESIFYIGKCYIDDLPFGSAVSEPV